MKTQKSALTPDYLSALCARTFSDRKKQRIEAVEPLSSRQHEVVSFRLCWHGEKGETCEMLIARRYVSTLSWWRPEDMSKAQREATIARWLNEHAFPAPVVYAREFGASGDVVLFTRVPGHDWSVSGRSFADAVRPHINEFAKLLARLHDLNPTDEIRAVAPPVRLPNVMANLMALALQTNNDELTTAIEQTMSHIYDVPELEAVLLHGDYHFSNVLIDDGQITGLVDWEYAAIGDPRWDVANAYSQLVDFDAAKAADDFLSAYLKYSGREFAGPPLYNVIAPLQQWAVSEWLVKQEAEGRSVSFAMAQNLIELRDVHRRRTKVAMETLLGAK